MVVDFPKINRLSMPKIKKEIQEGSGKFGIPGINTIMRCRSDTISSGKIFFASGLPANGENTARARAYSSIHGPVKNFWEERETGILRYLEVT
jgi:hypothetical protein